MNMNRAWQKDLEPGQESACGSGGGSDCLKIEPASDPGFLILSDTDNTFRAKVRGHEVTAFAAWIMMNGPSEELMKIISDDTREFMSELAPEQARFVVDAGIVG